MDLKRRKNREIMVFSISFLDVIASALGAILILFIIQYNKTQSARTEAVVSELRHSQCTEALQEFASRDTDLNTTTFAYDATSEKPFDRDTVFEHEKETDKPHPEEPVMAPLAVIPVAPMHLAPVPTRTARDSKLPEPVAGAPVDRPDSPSDATMDPAEARPLADPSSTRPDTGEAGEPGKVDTSSDEKERHEKVVDPKKPKTPPRPDTPEKPDIPEKTGKPAVPEKREKPPIPELPKGQKGRTLATCITGRDRVTVTFADYDEPDGDTIMVSWNGRNMTRIKLEAKPTAGYVFPLIQGRYNIIVIKNISNGFYPLNTASISISGCGQARWKMREIGDSRVVYIYRE